MSVFCAMQWSCNGRGATHCDKVGAAAPVLALVLVLVVAVSMYGAGFVGGVVGAVGGVVSALTLYKKLLPHNDAAGVVLRTWPRAWPDQLCGRLSVVQRRERSATTAAAAAGHKARGGQRCCCCCSCCCCYRPLLRRAWLQPRQKARPQNRFQSNNNRFKLLLQQPSLLQLRLTILTKQGCEECSRDTSDPPFRRVNLFRRWLRHAPANPG